MLVAFDRFYQAYPRRVAKQKALTAWINLNPDAEAVAAIMAAVERYTAEVKDGDPRYILHPATWLNDRRWEDEPAGGAIPNGKPRLLKELGGGLVECDGVRMDRRTFERRFGQYANT